MMACKNYIHVLHLRRNIYKDTCLNYLQLFSAQGYQVPIYVVCWLQLIAVNWSLWILRFSSHCDQNVENTFRFCYFVQPLAKYTDCYNYNYNYTCKNNNNNNNNYYYYYYYLLQLGCHPVAVVILHVYKIWNWLLLNLSREGHMRSM